MKETIKQQMMKRLHRRNSSSSSTASIDYTSGERLEFKFSGLQALQVPKGWDKLSLSLISVETGKTIAKTGRAAVQNGICRWTENLSERIWVPHDDASKGLEQCLYKLFISMGSGRSSILGEVTVNLSGHFSSENSTSIAQPLKNCSHGTILQVEIQCLTPRANLRWTDTDSFTEDANASDDLDNTSDASDGRITKSLGSSISSNFQYTSQAGGLGSRDRSLSAGGSRSSFDSMDDSFGRESCSPNRNLSEVANDLIGRQDSVRSSNSAQDSSYHVYDSPRSSHSLYSSGSGKNVLSQRQDSGKVSNSIPASPLRTSGSTEFALEAEGSTMEELRTEARMWERNTRKLMVDLDFLRKESRDQTKKLENATMEVLASRTECDGLKHEINYLKVLLDESAVKEKDADDLKLQVQDKKDIQTELEEEIKFQKELNDNLSLQLNRTQESNLELVSILQELEETIEKQRLEIESLTMLKLEQDGEEADTRVQVSDKKIRAVPCGSDYINNSIENPKTGFLVEGNDQWDPELQLQKFLESQKTLESIILHLEKTLEEKTQEIEREQVLKAQTLLDNELEWTKKLTLKDQEIFNLEEKLSEAHAAQFPVERESHSRETPDLIEIKALKDKIQELERDCNELTDENLELLYKLKESSKDLSTGANSISSSLGRRPGSESPIIEDSKMIKLECQTQQLKEEAKKRELDGIDAGYLQLRCNDLESKCVELEVNIQGFKDRAYYLDGELDKYREKAVEQEKEVDALKQSLKSQQEGKQENSFPQEGQAEVVLNNVVQSNTSLGNLHVAKYNVHGEETKPMTKDPWNVENKMDDSLKNNNDMLEKFNMELKSRVEDLGKELLAKTSEIEALKSGFLLKGREIPCRSYNQRDLKTQLSDMQILKSQLKGSLKAMQSDSTLIYECLDKVKSDMVMLNGTKDSQFAANKILEKKLLELESCNKELELHLAELEVENIHLSERISGLEPQLRYLTDARESSRLEIQHSETSIKNLQAEIRRLEEEIETSKVDMRQKLEYMQKRWLEAQEECEYLKKANPKLQNTAESLIEECSALEKSNRELKQQRLDLYNRSKDMEAELRESQHNFSKLSRNLEDLEDKFSLMINGVATKEKMFVSELEDLYLQNKEQTEKFVMGENLFNQMYSEKMVEIDNLQQEVAHLSTQIYATQDERDRMASEAVLEMHVLRADKDKLEIAIEDVKEKFRSSEKKLDTIQDEYEARIQDVMVELAASKQNHGILEANLDKLMELLENSRSNEEKLRITVGELHDDLKHCEYQGVQLTEEISSLKGQLQKVPLLQDEVVALKNSLNDVKIEGRENFIVSENI
ncbi:restin homolog [Cynara cardunculus var. scolymus]|uniref:restin homolog n=1 Tax=Cynara cardunculus var. scolymus TaxID=59895 RepID=UPI000D62B5AF|nr:restin homolog [Cynara cardunculus var. scolymus]